jgi:hypothetical protein
MIQISNGYSVFLKSLIYYDGCRLGKIILGLITYFWSEKVLFIGKKNTYYSIIRWLLFVNLQEDKPWIGLLSITMWWCTTKMQTITCHVVLQIINNLMNASIIYSCVNVSCCTWCFKKSFTHYIGSRPRKSYCFLKEKYIPPGPYYLSLEISNMGWRE